jgi:hypothetical protein
MTASKSNAELRLGFLRVADLGAGTLIGGYLILNALGRPLEFHCTEPVRPNRAQQILFGSTLEPYLYGEQIGHALVHHSELRPQLLVTDQRAVLAIRALCDIPVVWLDTAVPPSGYEAVEWGSRRVLLDQRDAVHRATVQWLCEQTSAEWNLQEPFERIQEAIAELQKAA